MKRPLGMLNHKITLAKLGYERGGSSQGRRAFFKALVSLEGQRERFYGIVAPFRRYNT